MKLQKERLFQQPTSRRNVIKTMGLATAGAIAGTAALSYEEALAQAEPPQTPTGPRVADSTPNATPSTPPADSVSTTYVGIDFKPISASIGWVSDGNYIRPVGSGGFFTTRLNLPQNSQIVQVEYYFYDTDPVQGMSLRLAAYTPSTGTVVDYATYSTPPTGGLIATATTSTSIPVDNTLHTYSLSAYIPSTTGTHRIHGARVSYINAAGTFHVLSSPIKILDSGDSNFGAGSLNPNPSGLPRLVGYGSNLTLPNSSPYRRTFAATGSGGVPAGALAVVGTLSSYSGPIDPPNARVTAWKYGTSFPLAGPGQQVVSEVHVAGVSRCNAPLTVALSSDGRFNIASNYAVHVEVTIVGYYL